MSTWKTYTFMVKVAREIRITWVRPVNVTENLRRLRERAGLSMKEMARKMKMKDASSYQRYENATMFKKKYIPMDVVEKLIPILTGRGVPPIASLEVFELAGFMEVLKRAMPTAKLVFAGSVDPEFVNKIPIVEWGKITMLVKGTLKREDIKGYADAGIASEDNSFVTDMPNGSMEPHIFQGDRVVCDRSAKIEPSNIVLAIRKKDDAVIIGRLRLVENGNRPQIEIVPANSNWPKYRIDDANPGEIVGKVVERRETLR